MLTVVFPKLISQRVQKPSSALKYGIIQYRLYPRERRLFWAVFYKIQYIFLKYFKKHDSKTYNNFIINKLHIFTVKFTYSYEQKKRAKTTLS